MIQQHIFLIAISFPTCIMPVMLCCRGITGLLTMQIYPDLPEVPIF